MMKVPDVNDYRMYCTLSQEEKVALMAWISLAIKGSETPCEATSYAIKEQFVRETGLYVSNGAFKGAMLELGLPPINSREPGREPYWEFCIERRCSQFHAVAGEISLPNWHFCTQYADLSKQKALAEVIEKAKIAAKERREREAQEVSNEVCELPEPKLRLRRSRKGRL